MKLQDLNLEHVVEKPAEEIRQDILGYMHDVAINFMVYDRRGDDEYRRGMIEEAVKQGALTADDIVAEFAKQLKRYF